MFLIELGHESWSMDILPRFPAGLLYTISLPFDQVFEMIMEHAAVENTFYFPFLFTVYKYWWWWWFWLTSLDRISWS